MVSKQLVIQNSFAGFQFMLKTLNALCLQFQTQYCYIGMEATGDYWKNLYYFLKRQSDSFIVTVINPVRTKAWAKTELRRAKTDSVNAKDIAQFIVEKKPRASFDRPMVFDNIKDIDRQVYLIKKQQTMITNKLRIELEKVAPEIEKAIKNFKGQQILALLAKYPTACDIRNASVSELADIRYGKYQWRLSETFIKNIKSLTRNSIAYKQGLGSGFVVQSLVRRLYQSQTEVRYLKERLVKLYQSVKEQKSVLASIPGITKETAIALEAYIGDVYRFSNSKKFVAYFGMNPTVNESGKSKRKSYLQKKGNPIVRHKLFMATLCVISKKKEPFYTYYRRLVDSGKPKLVAIGATMRKLLGICYALLKNNEKFKY
jgi:transposase